MNDKIKAILQPSLAPCSEFSGACDCLRFDPAAGQIPRGYGGATGELSEIDLVLVFAEPGPPSSGESYSIDGETIGTISSTVQSGFKESDGVFHRNVRKILELCFPGATIDDCYRRTWLTESVLCSTTGTATDDHPKEVEHACGIKYLQPQRDLLKDAFWVALGAKARDRMRAVGLEDFFYARSPAPPGGNSDAAEESWIELGQKFNGRSTV